MTDEEIQACETIMDEARKALPNGTDEQLLDWAAARLTPKLRIALNTASTDEIIRYQARSLGTRPRRYH